MIMKTRTIKWLVAGAVSAGMLAFSVGANAASSTGAAMPQAVPSQHLQLAAKDCGGVIKASAMKDDKMAGDAMKDDKMATEVAMKDDKMADDKMAKDAMKDDKMAEDTMKTDVMADATDCADKDTMKN